MRTRSPTRRSFFSSWASRRFVRRTALAYRMRPPRYATTVQRTKRPHAHDEKNDLRVGDRVRIVETRPLSKLKRWRVSAVLERAK